jgi:hypothetical protein
MAHPPATVHHASEGGPQQGAELPVAKEPQRSLLEGGKVRDLVQAQDLAQIGMIVQDASILKSSEARVSTEPIRILFRSFTGKAHRARGIGGHPKVNAPLLGGPIHHAGPITSS